jgi:hypothetical protein
MAFATRRVLRLCLRALVLLLLSALLLAAAVWGCLHPEAEVTRGVVYGQRHGQNLTLEVHDHASRTGVVF